MEQHALGRGGDGGKAAAMQHALAFAQVKHRPCVHRDLKRREVRASKNAKKFDVSCGCARHKLHRVPRIRPIGAVLRDPAPHVLRVAGVNGRHHGHDLVRAPAELAA